MNPFGFYVDSKGYTPEPGVAKQKKSGFRQLRLLPHRSKPLLFRYTLRDSNPGPTD